MKLIRDYIATHIKKEFKGCQESDAAFTTETFGLEKQKTSYHLEFGAFTPVDYSSGQYITDEVAVAVKIYTNTKKAKTSDFDEQQEKATRIRSEIANPANRKGTKIARVAPENIELLPTDGNPEIIETTINFIFEVTQ